MNRNCISPPKSHWKAFEVGSGANSSLVLLPDPEAQVLQEGHRLRPMIAPKVSEQNYKGKRKGRVGINYMLYVYVATIYADTP